MQSFFDDENSPDLLDVKLKGRHLAELSTAMFEQRDILRSSIAAFPKNDMIQIGGILGLLTEMGEYFKSPEAQRDGITQRELETVIGNMMANPSENVRDSLAEIRMAEREETVQDQKVALNDSIEGYFALLIKGEFSAALAVQEGREADYKKAIDKTSQAVLSDTLANTAFLDEDEKSRQVLVLVASMEPHETTLRTALSRRSPTASLLRYDVESSREMVKEVIASMFDLDASTPAGQRGIKQKIEEAQAMVGSIKLSVA